MYWSYEEDKITAYFGARPGVQVRSPKTDEMMPKTMHRDLTLQAAIGEAVEARLADVRLHLAVYYDSAH
jgi:hypothetical protein